MTTNCLLRNLKTISTGEVQAHLDRMKDSELFFARLQAAEILAGREVSALVMTRHIMALRASREALTDHYNRVNGEA